MKLKIVTSVTSKMAADQKQKTSVDGCMGMTWLAYSFLHIDVPKFCIAGPLLKLALNQATKDKLHMVHPEVARNAGNDLHSNAIALLASDCCCWR